MSSMFWGLNMKPNRKYSQTIIKSFHISGVALDEGDNAKLYLTAEKQKHVVATVSKAMPQVQLDLNFRQGDKIIFQTTGNATVSLVGYLHDIETENSDDEFDEEEYSKIAKALKKQAAAGGESDDEDEDDDDDEEDEDVNISQLSAEYSSLGEGEDSDESGEEEDDDEDEEDEEEDDSEDEPPQAKQPKLEVKDQKPGKEQNGVAKNEKQPKNKKDKKEAAADIKEQPKPKDAKPATGERTLSGGVKIEDLRVGNGPEAKQGKRVGVYYVGRLKSNNKVFDSSQKGNGFKFALGKGEVIKGWDIGVVGMKVGGKRRVTCPPHMAYGARGSPPAIPGNSTLVFDVELKSVN